MGFFDKVTQTASILGKNISDMGFNLGATLTVAEQGETELKQLKAQKNVVEQELDALYTQVGKRYIDHVIKTGDLAGIPTGDLIKLMSPKMAKKKEIETRIIELEKEIKEQTILREKQIVEEEFFAEKERLDKALGMDILTQEEYDYKIQIAKKKMLNFEEIRRIKKQAEMGLITYEEMEAKLRILTE